MHRFRTTIVLALATLFFASTSLAQQTQTTSVPNLIRYGGTLKDASEAPIASTTGVTFSVYKQQDGGAPVWMETQNVTTDANGNYSVLLGSTTATGLPGDLFSQQEPRWLGVQVQGQAEQPRVLLVSVPYAMKANEADRLAGHAASEFVTSETLQSAVQQQLQQQGGATTSSGSTTANSKSAKAGIKPAVPTVTATNFIDTTANQVVLVQQNGTGRALTASTNSTTNGAAGVLGSANGTAGYISGVYGHSASSTGTGVSGNATAATGYTSGVYGTCASATGCSGVNGNITATSGVGAGVSGENSSSSNGANGVYGLASATTGVTFGVQGVSLSSQGVGVQGSSPSVAVAGFNQVCKSGSCTLLKGIAGKFVTATGGIILQGLSGSSYTQVFSVDASGNGFYAGNLNITGKLTKGSGSFKIDHPLDPANRYLSHSFVESPDMMNVYNGNVTTDQQGLATVVLPEYFGVINRDFRYQLTVIGQFAQAIVKREIENNRFTIKTNKPSVKVSWQVTGIRQDAYANAYRIQVEEEKPPQEQGHYLHPELFGAPPEQAVGYNAPGPTHAESARLSSLTAPSAPLK